MVNFTKFGIVGLGVALGISLASSSVFADGHDNGHGHGNGHGGSHWHGDIHGFYAHDYPYWHGGHWYHGDHYGRWGWWWLAGGMWYYYPAPIYPYPNPYAPSTVIIQQEPTTEVLPQQQSWYYCQSARKYYPYASECPEGWKAVPATPPDGHAQ